MPGLLKTLARKIILPALKQSGTIGLLPYFQSKNRLILNYHGVVNNLDQALSINHMSAYDFEQQIIFFKKNFNILNQEDFIQNSKEKYLKKKSILITFDDGYFNNYSVAFPILKKHNIPATIFPVTGLIDSAEMTWYDAIDLSEQTAKKNNLLDKIKSLALECGMSDQPKFTFHQLKKFLKTQSTERKSDFLFRYGRMLNLDEIKSSTNPEYWKILSSSQMKEMHDSDLITFGSHTVNHPNLDTLESGEMSNELRDSKLRIETILGEQIDSIAFPDGAYNDQVKEKARELGYNTLFSVTPRCTSDKNDSSIFRRLSISNTTTFESVIFQTCFSFDTHGIGSKN